MSIINNSYAIGVDTRNLVLKTRGTLHVKVGDRYYEIDFRNLTKSNEEEEEKEEFIIPIDNKDSIDSLDYPGDNKLIVGLDGSWFITKDNTYIDITPKQQITDTSEEETESTNNLTFLNQAFVKGFLYGEGGLLVDFANAQIEVDNLVVNKSLSYPNNTIKNNCCKSIEGEVDYADKDFIELNHVPAYLIVKSGVMIKSNIEGELLVYSNSIDIKIDFQKGGLYIIYLSNNQLNYSKLN